MNSKRLNLALVFGGRSGEHDVSLMSARSVMSSIDPEKYQVWQIGITRKGDWLTGQGALETFENHDFEALQPAILLKEGKTLNLYALNEGKLEKVSDIDVIFPILHGPYGEDGTIQGYFEMLDVAYVGAGVLGSSLAMDKGLTKDVMLNKDFPVLAYGLFTRNAIENNIEAVVEESETIANYPLFIKPANLGSSVGISKAKNREELLKALRLAAKYDRRILVERGINAREIEVSVLGNEALIVSEPGEVIPGDEFYSYDDKYIDGVAQTLIPADLSPEIIKHIQNIAVQVYKALDCAGLARVDFLMDQDTNEIFFSEINTMPGFTPISMYPKLLNHGGITYTELIDRLIALALERKADKDKTLRSVKA